MDYKEIKKLMDDMGNSKLTEMEIEFKDGMKISMKKDDQSQKVVSMPVLQTEPITPAIVSPTSISTVAEKKDNSVKQGNVVKSPMVGTFYSKSSPDALPFVKIGSKVKKGDKLCIIEAMKLMNEIESEFDGEVIDILVNNEEMVDYGKPLFIIK